MEDRPTCLIKVPLELKVEGLSNLLVSKKVVILK